MSAYLSFQYLISSLLAGVTCGIQNECMDNVMGQGITLSHTFSPEALNARISLAGGMVLIQLIIPNPLPVQHKDAA